MNKKLIENKICAILLAGLGVMSASVDNDFTCLLFLLMIAIPMFFAKESWLYK